MTLPADGVCSSCKAPIAWALSSARKAGEPAKSMPVNPEPSDTGNLSVYEMGGKRFLAVIKPGQARAMRAAGRPTYAAHWVDCPNADEHRKRGAR